MCVMLDDAREDRYREEERRAQEFRRQRAEWHAERDVLEARVREQYPDVFALLQRYYVPKQFPDR